MIGRDRGAGGGALATLGLIARLGLGGKVGNGTQACHGFMRMILTGLFARAITDDLMKGVYIASAPSPILASRLYANFEEGHQMPIGLPAFEWMVRIGAPLFLRTDPELALYGRYVVSKRLADEGFVFQFPELELALRDLFRST